MILSIFYAFSLSLLGLSLMPSRPKAPKAFTIALSLIAVSVLLPFSLAHGFDILTYISLVSIYADCAWNHFSVFYMFFFVDRAYA